MNLEQLNSVYSLMKTPELFGRYITNSDIEKSLKQFPKSLISTIGFSVEKRPIYSLKFGRGSIKILLWSQMHGNESTTTKPLFDCFNLFQTNNPIVNSILEACTLCVIPILNPDGAERYTRLNANEIDLNRDAQDLSQPESVVLRDVFKSFQPDYCFNLHGQRTIFGVGDSGVSATLSFLSPSQDAQRSLTPNRKVVMSIISEINKVLQIQLPNGIGRYNDDFNLNCVGDTFQKSGVPTVLFEAGHYPNDYQREEVRRFIFMALIKSLQVISEDVNILNYEDYFKIPENSKCFYDIIIRNARIRNNEMPLKDIGIQYKEVLKANTIVFNPVVDSISSLDDFYGHREIDAKGNFVEILENLELKEGDENDFVLVNNKKIALLPKKY
ncbi:MAG: M14 family zinc carboxypeptidase [Winogradskyella sp.]|nr:M14 family zinc carboxypeptidase [Winogradskyella sp.]